MPRVCSPPISELNRLRTPLTPGERRVFDWLDAELHPGWAIYIQPHLNGLRPDFVLLHPEGGIIILEVKDWNLNSGNYRTRADSSGRVRLEFHSDDGWKPKHADDPVNRLVAYRDQVESCCSDLDRRFARRVIACAVVMTNASRRVALTLLSPLLEAQFPHLDRYPMNCTVLGSEDLAAGTLSSALRPALRTKETGMNEAVASQLRHWLIEPEYSAEQREQIRLSADQKRLVQDPRSGGWRRVRGPAGAGKSLVLACRAAELLGRGKEVLVVTFNLTLLNYLKDLAVRWPLPPGKQARKQIIWLNFHSWCRRVCQLAGRGADYRALWKGRGDDTGTPNPAEVGDADNQRILDEGLANLVAQVLDGDPEEVSRFDAILIDEGQDFRVSWLRVLGRCLQPGGELLLMADKTQDIYRRSRLLTEPAMEKTGFRGAWAHLQISYRMPAKLSLLLREFAERFLPRETRDPPVPVPLQTDFDQSLEPCFLRWIQTDPEDALPQTLAEVERLSRHRDREELPMTDLTLLAVDQRSGLTLSESLESKGLRVHHTFAPGDRAAARRRKLGFYKGTAEIKATTVHSFKGLEARALVICFNPAESHAMRTGTLALFYAAMSRLKRTERGAHLSVVCSVPELASYGAAWPEGD